ncbi:HXXEE domain-containing protein [Rhodobacteraceae bacterium N5(2021)]|uniref:HXXEE domain-containing protein n=1 Tax=Gymnodinialimonas phycosphaerae TaxID=2841589 RepID=A0A975TUJ1_9RHOB|nr:HXXEE domain-containing protein [Gymnodinialimonas phycosphaerae]MBY4894899.1 HXXEE domain-containing protein [Gymnodinialimonas phycosphaerae]
MMERIYQNWVYGGILAASILLLLAPLLGWPLPALLVFLALPIYMIHQFEEHDADRFRLFVNGMMGPSVRGLSHRAVFVINYVGVWLFIMAAIWLVREGSPGWGALAGYLLVINAVAHIVQGLALRKYNPGLITAIITFLPLGVAIVMTCDASLVQHGVSLAAVIALHGAIIVHARKAAVPPPNPGATAT